MPYTGPSWQQIFQRYRNSNHSGSITVDSQKAGSVHTNVANQSPSHRQSAFVGAIGGSETGFSQREAHSEKYNQPGNNPNVRQFGQKGADYGYFQMNQMDVDEAVRMGISPNVAKNLTGGGPHGGASLQDQANAVNQYLKAKWPKEYEEYTQTGDFEKMRRVASGKWHGLRRPAAQEQFNKMIKDKSAIPFQLNDGE